MFIFDEKTGTNCTLHGCTGRAEGVLMLSRWLSFEKLFQKHIQLIIFDPKDYLLVLHFEVEGVKGRLGIWLAACKVSRTYLHQLMSSKGSREIHPPYQ